MSRQKSLILTSSPLRRKSMMNLSISDSSLPQNDDDAERLERRRNAEMEMRQSGSLSSSSDRRKSIGGGAIAGLSAGQLAEHYSNCIKLSAKNKINTKNAFSLQLIDYMAMMLKKRDSQMNNFQVASCTLDASTKIYGYRVDYVHTEVLKMAGGLAAGSRKKNAGNEREEEEGGDDPDKASPTAARKKKSQKPKNVIASNIESLSEKTEQHAMDPFFLRSTGNMNDCQPGDCRFLGNLKMLKNCGLMLNSDMLYWDAGDNIASIENIDVPLPHISISSNKNICSVFAQFHFTSWSLDDEESTDSPQVIPGLSDADNDFAFDVNAVPEPVPVCDNDLPADNFDEYGVDDDFDSDGEEVPAATACAATERTPAAKIIDLRKHLSSAHSEYSYFRTGALDLWAGPSHWKIRPVRSTGRMTLPDGTGENAACKKQKPKQKKDLTIEFDSEEINVPTMNLSRTSLKLTKRTISKVWGSEKNTHPPDMHYDCKSLLQLLIRRLVGISIDPVPVEDNETSGYDYENVHDTSEYCPNVASADELDDADADDGGGGDSEGFLMTQPQDIHNSLALAGTTLTEAFTGDNLVAPPSKVAKIFIPYAMRAKKMDMKKLKAAIWKIMTNADGHKDARALKIEKPVDFSYVYSSLPSHLSSKLTENLSTPLAVVALLHLANEKTLCIEGKENLTDFTISQE